MIRYKISHRVGQFNIDQFYFFKPLLSENKIMRKLILIPIFFIFCHLSFAQSEKLEVEGAVIISNSEPENPTAGTIRWTGEDFEGFNGTVWESLTSCDLVKSESIEFLCPNEIITNPNFLTQVVHTDPLSQVVNYDLFVNGQDTGPSYSYDPSQTLQTNIRDLSPYLSDSGTATFDLYYFYDNDPSVFLLANSCLVNYDFTGSSATHACFGFDLIQKIDSYVKPDFSCEPDQVFTSVSALNAKINSVTDHAGAVYQLAGGRYNNSQLGSNGINITDKRNLTVCSDPSNPAILDGQNLSNFAIRIREANGTTDNITVTGFDITQTKFHGIFVGNDATGKGGGNIYIGGNHIYEAANVAGAGITVRNTTAGKTITIEANEIERIDINGNSSSARGEGIYVGEGNNGSNFGNDVVIRGNYVHDMGGEAIDIKRHSRDILIEYNRIENIVVFSQGAITLALDRLDGANTYDANMVVRRNCISNVTTTSFDGEGIVVGNGNTLIEENLIYDIVNNPIDVYNDADGPGKTVTIKNNILWNYGGLPVRENYGSGNGGPVDPFTIIRQSNIVDSNSSGNECLETASIFVGPLTAKAGFSPN